MLTLAPNTTSRAPRKASLMDEQRFGDHFTPADRERLIKTAVNLENLTNAVGKLEGAINNNNAELERRLDKFEERVRILENFRYWMLGAAAGVGALGGYFGGKFHP